MTQNMGTVDRMLRIAVAIAVAALYFTGRIGGMLAIVLGLFAAVFVVTSFIGTCPLYLPLGISTRKR
ncbi:MAG: DUF2892 domain-containing protein [Thermoanaerobaculia bacterium]